LSTLKESFKVIPDHLGLLGKEIMNIAALSKAVQMIQVLLGAAFSKAHQFTGDTL